MPRPSPPRSPLHRLTPRPPLGWNSYDCFLGDGTKYDSANEWTLLQNLEVFAEKLRPAGYEYFVLDCRWFSPTADGSLTRLDRYGRSLPSEIRFPRGFRPIVKRCQALGVKFGLHLIRGIPKKAVALNTPVKGTRLRARDIASPEIDHRWDVMASLDLAKEGAQEYYNSVLDLLAEWEVDFLKYDEIVPHPRDVAAVLQAVEQCGRPIVLSLSPGDWTPTEGDIYRRANMLRITADIWDRREDLERGFARWEEFQEFGGSGFWIDLDMIPFGHLCVPYPALPDVKAPYMGGERRDRFTPDQKRSFLAQRALAASPLFAGGNLPGTDELAFSLLTNPEVLACNQNGVTGKLQERRGKVEVWRAPHCTRRDCGWIGIFNRGGSPVRLELAEYRLGLAPRLSYRFTDVWTRQPVAEGMAARFRVGPDGVIFLRYEPERAPQEESRL